jgi:hypothetical protein
MGMGINDQPDFKPGDDCDSDDRLAADYDASSIADVHPLWALTVVSAFWLVVWTALFGISEAVLWVASFFAK